MSSVIFIHLYKVSVLNHYKQKYRIMQHKFYKNRIICYNTCMKKYLIMAIVLVGMSFESRSEGVDNKVTAEFVNAYKRKVFEVGKLIGQIQANKPSIKLDYAKALAEEIYKHSKAYGINPRVVSAILALESMYEFKAVNKKSSDYGIAQINEKTIVRYNFDRVKIMKNISYSIEAGVKVLSYFHKRYSKKEPDSWYVRYNVGTAHKANVSSTGLNYKRLLSKYL